MNHDEPQFPSSDEIIEARIVAWVLGESSPFEIAELTRMLSEKPALQDFKKQIESVHGLLGEAVSSTVPLQLSSERRRELLGKLGMSATEAAAASNPPSSINSSNTGSGANQVAEEKPASLLVYPNSASRRIQWMKGLSIACSLLLAFMILKVSFSARKTGELDRSVVLDEVQKSSPEPSRRELALKGDLAAIEAPKEEKELVSPVAMPPVPAEVTLSVSSQLVAPEKQELNGVALESDQPVKLDRFVVNASEDAGGYGASSTLAGNRVKADLKIDLPQIAFSTKAKSSVSEVATNSSVRANYETASVTGEPGRQEGSGYPGRNALTNSLSQGSTIADSRSWGAAQALPESEASKHNSVLSGKESPVLGPEATNQDDQIVLSPFSVTAKSGTGESPTANSTLAGTRIRTDLRDMSSAISVVTQQFLADTTSPNAQEHLGYSEDKSPARNRENSNPTDKHPEHGPEVSGKVVPKKASHAAPTALRSELTASAESVSTFSLHVSDVSFRLAVASMARGERPDPASIRPEEFYNAFDYGDPTTNFAEQVSCRIEQSAHPELQQRNLLRIAVRVPATGRSASQPLRLTVMLDTSGSMQRDDRAAAVRRAMQVLVSLLGPADRVTLIGFSRTPHLLAESVPGDQAQALLKIVAQTPAEGGTNLEAALTLAGQLAQRQRDASAQNRIVLLTDGAANLGNAIPAQLAAQVVKFRQEGIAFDACGVGSDGVDDTMLESLTRDGDGRYTLLSDADASADEFAHQLAGAFRPAAKNVKVQVRFNPARVGHYRLIGFEQHRLKPEDFRNDQVDAAELAANEAAIAVYQVEPLPQGDGELGEVFVRFQDAATGKMIERSWVLPYDAHVAAFDRASPTMQLAGAATLVAEKLQGEPVRLEVLRGPMNALRSRYKNEAAVQNLVTLFNELRRAPDSK